MSVDGRVVEGKREKIAAYHAWAAGPKKRVPTRKEDRIRARPSGADTDTDAVVGAVPSS